MENENNNEKKDKNTISGEEFSIYNDATRIIIQRDYATSPLITKFDENAFPKAVDARKVFYSCLL